MVDKNTNKQHSTEFNECEGHTSKTRVLSLFDSHCGDFFSLDSLELKNKVSKLTKLI